MKEGNKSAYPVPMLSDGTNVGEVNQKGMTIRQAARWQH